MSLQCVLGLPHSLLPAGHAWNRTWGRLPEGIGYRGFAPSSSQVTVLIRLILMERPADVSYKSVDLFFTIVCTVTKELPWTLCSSCQDLLYNSTNHFIAFLLFSVSLICFASVNVKFQQLQVFLEFICTVIYSKAIEFYHLISFLCILQQANQEQTGMTHQDNVKPSLSVRENAFLKCKVFVFWLSLVTEPMWLGLWNECWCSFQF